MTSNAVTMFDFDSESVRAAMIDDNPWFVGKDVCRVLEISNHNDALGRLADDERRYQSVGTATAKGVGNGDPLSEKGVGSGDPLVNPQRLVLISEPGLCRLVFTSQTEKAERVKRWVFHEVLPALRKTGQYTMSEHVGRTTRMERDDDPIDLDAAPLGQIRIAVSLLREVRIIFGIGRARKVARRIPAIAEIVGRDERRTEDGEVIEEDDVEMFAGDMLIEASQSALTAAEIWKAYRDWCRNNESVPVTQTMLGRRLRTLGYQKKQGGGVVRYVGIALFVPEPEPEKKD